MEQTPRNVLVVPALPIVQSGVMSLSPTFKGVRHDGHMNKLNAHVRGEITRVELLDYLKAQDIDPNVDQEFAIFLKSIPEQTAACAAYMASVVLTAPNHDEYLEPAGTKNEKGEPEIRINEEKIAQAMATKLALAQANADIFSLIAKEMPANLSLHECRAEVIRLFSLLAPMYMERARHHFPGNVQFKVVTMTTEQFVFNSNIGYLFSFDHIDGLQLRLGGMNWYGRGEFLGHRYTLPIAYLPEEVNALFA